MFSGGSDRYGSRSAASEASAKSRNSWKNPVTGPGTARWWLALQRHAIAAPGSQSKLGVAVCHYVSKGDHLGSSGSANGSPHLHLGRKHGDPGALIGSPTAGYVDHRFP